MFILPKSISIKDMVLLKELLLCTTFFGKISHFGELMKVHFELQVNHDLYMTNTNKIPMYFTVFGVHPQYEI
jgi:hypothetical protein